MKIGNCIRCWKQIEIKGAKKYCNACRRAVDKELSIKYRYEHYKGWTIRKPEDFERIDEILARRKTDITESPNLP